MKLNDVVMNLSRSHLLTVHGLGRDVHMKVGMVDGKVTLLAMGLNKDDGVMKVDNSGVVDHMLRSALLMLGNPKLDKTDAVAVADKMGLTLVGDNTVVSAVSL